MNDTPVENSSVSATKGTQKHHFWDDSWIGVFILMLIAAALGGLLSRLWPGGDGLFATPSGELSERVAALDARVIQLTNAQSATPADDLNAIRERMVALEDRVKAAETALASNPQNKTAALSAEAAPGAPPQNLEAAAKQIQDLQARLAVVELGAVTAAAGVSAGAGASVGAQSMQTEIQPLKDGLAKANETLVALSARLDEIKSKVDAAGDPATLVAAVRGDLDGVKGRVDKIEQADIAGSSRRAALGAAVANLARAAQSGQPFSAELTVMRGLQPADASLAALVPYASKGAPVLSALQSSFGAKADLALKAERDATAGQGLDRLWSGMTSMVSVRATGTPNGNDTASILARAESKLKTGDLAIAVLETGKLQGPARAVMDTWRREADARLKLDTAIANVSRAIADSLTRSAAAPPAAPTAAP